MYVLGIGDLIKEGIAGVILLLDTIIYGLISGAYKIFMALASARLLSSDAYTQIANSLYAIIGVVMLFVLAYAIIRTIMDPDQATKGELSGANLVKGIAIAVIGLAITPYIFEYLYQAQGLFVEHDVVGKIFFRNFDNNEIDLGKAGITTSSNDECQNQSNSTAKTNCYVKSVGGAVAATSIWTAFFYPSNPCDENGKPDGCKGANDITIEAKDLYVKGGQLIAIGAGVGTALVVAAAVGWIPVAGWVIGGLLAAGALIYAGVQTIREGNKVNELTDGQSISLAQAYAASSSGEGFTIYTGFLSKYQSDGDITYLWGVSTLCGIFALYAFVSFSIDMGVRAAKLAYYQIIAPIPIVLQILPKFKKNFTQYVSNLFQTFMEVFIRISVVYIVVYIICHLTEMFSSSDRLWDNNQLTFTEKSLALALLIMGLIIFAKDAPKIITESLGIQGGMGDFKSLREKLTKGGFFGAASLAGAAAGGLARGAMDDRGDNGRTGFNKFRHRVATATSGMLESAGRNAWAQIKPNHKKIDGFSAARDAAAESVDAADVAREKRMKDGQEYKDAAQQAREDQRDIRRLERLRSKLENGGTADDKDKELLKSLGLAEDASTDDMELKLEELKKDKKVQQNVATKYSVGGKLTSKWEDVREQMTPVSDPTKEKEKMDYATKLKKLNGDLRDLAYEEEGTYASEKHREYLQEQQKKVSRYQDGWDDDSIREEATARRTRISTATSDDMIVYMKGRVQTIQDKLDTDTTLSAEERTELEQRRDSYKTRITDMETITEQVQTQKTALVSKQQEITAIDEQISRLDTTAPDYGTQLATLQSQRATLESQRNALQSALQSRTNDLEMRTETLRTTLSGAIQAEVDLDYKLSEKAFAEAQQAHAEKVKNLKEQAEAAADAWIYEASLDEDNLKVADKISSFVAENIAYVRANGDQVLRTEKGEMTLRQTMENLAGAQAYTAGEYSTRAAQQDQTYTKQNEFTYGPDGSEKVYYRKGYEKNPDGSVKRDSAGRPILSEKFMFYTTPQADPNHPETDKVQFRSEADFFGQQGAGGIKALTPAAKAGKFGNDSSRYTNIHEYTPKQQRAMQRREKKDKPPRG